MEPELVIAIANLGKFAPINLIRVVPSETLLDGLIRGSTDFFAKHIDNCN